MVAGRRGLFHLTSTGTTQFVIDRVRAYNSCVAMGNTVYAYCYNPSQIFTYKLENGNRQVLKITPLRGIVQDTAFVTLGLPEPTLNDELFACSINDAKVFVLSQSGGKLLATLGEPGHQTAGKLCWPLLCDVDTEGFVLVADRDNNRLQVCDRAGQWSVPCLQPPVARPTGAAIIDNKFYVASCGDVNKLTLYTAQ